MIARTIRHWRAIDRHVDDFLVLLPGDLFDYMEKVRDYLGEAFSDTAVNLKRLTAFKTDRVSALCGGAECVRSSAI